jgi:hypothetical protein
VPSPGRHGCCAAGPVRRPQAEVRRVRSASTAQIRRLGSLIVVRAAPAVDLASNTRSSVRNRPTSGSRVNPRRRRRVNCGRIGFDRPGKPSPAIPLAADLGQCRDRPVRSQRAPPGVVASTPGTPARRARSKAPSQAGSRRVGTRLAELAPSMSSSVSASSITTRVGSWHGNTAFSTSVALPLTHRPATHDSERLRTKSIANRVFPTPLGPSSTRIGECD